VLGTARVPRDDLEGVGSLGDRDGLVGVEVAESLRGLAGRPGDGQAVDGFRVEEADRFDEGVAAEAPSVAIATRNPLGTITEPTRLKPMERHRTERSQHRRHEQNRVVGVRRRTRTFMDVFLNN
jgi:hypothetical protein